MTHLESILLTTNLRSVKIKNEFDGRQISRLLIDIKGITQQINPRASSTSSENRKIPITWHALKFLVISRSFSVIWLRSSEVKWGQVRSNGVKWGQMGSKLPLSKYFLTFDQTLGVFLFDFWISISDWHVLKYVMSYYVIIMTHGLLPSDDVISLLFKLRSSDFKSVLSSWLGTISWTELPGSSS